MSPVKPTLGLQKYWRIGRKASRWIGKFNKRLMGTLRWQVHSRTSSLMPKRPRRKVNLRCLSVPLVLIFCLGASKKAPRPRDENVVPAESLQVPTSPSKRRQATCHYSDLESSPSKRQSTKPLKLNLPASERKLLFGETTNHKGGLEDTVPMDVSLADLSMRDVEGTEKPSVPIVPVVHKTTTNTKTRSTKRVVSTAKRRTTVRQAKS